MLSQKSLLLLTDLEVPLFYQIHKQDLCHLQLQTHLNQTQVPVLLPLLELSHTKLTNSLLLGRKLHHQTAHYRSPVKDIPQRSRKNVLENTLIILVNMFVQSLAITKNTVFKGLVKGLFHSVKNEIQEAVVYWSVEFRGEGKLLIIEVYFYFRKGQDVVPQALSEYQWFHIAFHELIIWTGAFVEIALRLLAEVIRIPRSQDHFGTKITKWFISSCLSRKKLTKSRQISSIEQNLVSNGLIVQEVAAQLNMHTYWLFGAGGIQGLLLGVFFGGIGEVMRGECISSLILLCQFELLLKNYFMLRELLVGVLRTGHGLLFCLGELNIFQDLISSFILSSTQACLLLDFYRDRSLWSLNSRDRLASLDESDSYCCSSSMMLRISSLMLILLLERVFYFDYENLCLSVLKVSLKSFMVISEFQTDAARGTTFLTGFCCTARHQFWMILTLPMMYLASFMYLRVMQPLKKL